MRPKKKRRSHPSLDSCQTCGYEKGGDSVMAEQILNYRTRKVGDKGHHVHVILLPEGRGFTWDVEDSKNRLIRRELKVYETPGEAECHAADWVSDNLADL